MRKRTMAREPGERVDWLNLAAVAEVEISSEAPQHPIEGAILEQGGGWQAAGGGEQVVRLHFDEPRVVRRIELQFDERRTARTQEFVLRWSADGGRSWRDIVRQQYNFSPPSTTRETERYTVDLAGVTQLELRVVPDINHGPAPASLSSLRVA